MAYESENCFFQRSALLGIESQMKCGSQQLDRVGRQEPRNGDHVFGIIG